MKLFINIDNKKEPTEVEIKKVFLSKNGIKLFIWKDHYYRISEYQTGMGIVYFAKTIKQAVAALEDTLNENNLLSQNDMNRFILEQNFTALNK